MKPQSSASFSDILVAFGDFMIMLEHARDKETFDHAKKYLSSCMRCAEFGNFEYSDMKKEVEEFCAR